MARVIVWPALAIIATAVCWIVYRLGWGVLLLAGGVALAWAVLDLIKTHWQLKAVAMIHGKAPSPPRRPQGPGQVVYHRETLEPVRRAEAGQRTQVVL